MSRFVLLLSVVLTACAVPDSGSSPSECGNGLLEVGESCDDGNTTGGDGCSALCDREDQQGSAECGNGVLEASETCDDGNRTAGDGCDASCLDENDDIGSVCGDGTKASSEECDDGNLEAGDGCDEECKREPKCGDGIIDEELDEECDDGNRVADDGCDAECLLEGNCGNGTLDREETCDDGNLANGDGCDSQCQLENPTCGNGTLNANEECDDGNMLNGDGCSSDCKQELAGLCFADFPAVCNTVDLWSTSAAGSTDYIDQYSCNSFSETGREYTYVFAPAEDTEMSITLSHASTIDLDLFILSDGGNLLCEQGNCSLYADNTINVLFPGGGLYWIVVDGYLGDEGNYSIEFSCPDENTCNVPSGNNGESCADVYQGQDIWRCATSPALGGATVSQVCRDSGAGPRWITFHTDPMSCCDCAGDFSTACCAENSGSIGCP